MSRKMIKGCILNEAFRFLLNPAGGEVGNAMNHEESGTESDEYEALPSCKNCELYKPILRMWTTQDTKDYLMIVWRICDLDRRITRMEAIYGISND